MFVYSIQDKTHKIVPGKVTWCDKNYTAEKLYKITLDDDTYCIMAGEHEVIMRDGSKKRADLLMSGESIMPFYVKDEPFKQSYISKYQKVYNPNSGKFEFTHRLIAEHVNSNHIHERSKVVHHIDFNRFNNSPTNLQWMGWHEHRHYHNQISEQNKEIRRNATIAAWRNNEKREKHIRNLNVMFSDNIWKQIEKAIISQKIYNRNTLLNFINNELIDELLSTNVNKRLHNKKYITRGVVEHRINDLGFTTISEYLDETAKKLGCKLPSDVYSEKKSEYGKLNDSVNYFKGITKPNGIVYRSANVNHHNYGKKPNSTVYFNEYVWNEIRNFILQNRNVVTNDVVSFINSNLLTEIKNICTNHKNADSIKVTKVF